MLLKRRGACTGRLDLGMGGALALRDSTDAPQWTRDNPFLVSAYRPPCDWRSAVYSAFRWHNETVNVWSHAIGAAVAVALLVSTHAHLVATNQPIIVRLAFAVYLTSMATGMALSAAMHLLSIQSSNAAKVLARLDHVGVLLLLWGSDAPTTLLGLACWPTLRTTYFAGATLVCGVGCVAVLLDWCRNRTARTAIFVLVAATGWTHLCHEVVLRGVASRDSAKVLQMWCASFAAYGVGLVFFTSFWPERSFPGRFDIVGASHQLWHLCVLAGALLHYRTCWTYAQLFESTCPLVGGP